MRENPPPLRQGLSPAVDDARRGERDKVSGNELDGLFTRPLGPLNPRAQSYQLMPRAVDAKMTSSGPT
jgi:hypothetical protein